MLVFPDLIFIHTQGPANNNHILLDSTQTHQEGKKQGCFLIINKKISKENLLRDENEVV
jgi:hypothetical protein